MIERADARTLTSFVRKSVSGSVDLVATDDNSGYDYLKAMGYEHEAVKHSDHEFERGEVHTQSIDSFGPCSSGGVVGTYHNVSKKYLPL
jgi:hypothetical protein